MVPPAYSVLLAAPHHGLVEGIRSLLGTAFDTVVMVADEASLCTSTCRLRPELAVLDIGLAHGDLHGLIERLRLACPELRVIVLSGHDAPAIRQTAMEAGADGWVSQRAVATDLLPAVEAVLRGERYFPD